MLEAAIVLECVLGKFVEAGIIAALLVFNAVLGLVQESRAQATLNALKSRLALNASVQRDGAWSIVPAADLVPGDVVKLSLGGVVAADMKLVSGNALLDHSMLTGESVPVEAAAGAQTFAGALVRRGEAVAVVTATGARTRFGRTAELIRTAHVVSSQQKAVLLVVRNLAVFSVVVIAMLVACALSLHLPLADIVPLVLTAVLASIPVALPATFTLSANEGEMKTRSVDLRMQAGAEVSPGKWPTMASPFYTSKEHYQELLSAHVTRLNSLQPLFYASNRHALLLIFQAMDSAGNDGAIKHVMSGVNPQGCQVFSVKHSMPTGQKHDFRRRTTRDFPARGQIGIINRSYYEEVRVPHGDSDEHDGIHEFMHVTCPAPGMGVSD
ncbi:HAD-IC family P-type ATPase [Paraburkholderia xenovorans]|nr:HAD-IC family P-type ATPase [Paraburkholderia xenovorans]